MIDFWKESDSNDIHCNCNCSLSFRIHSSDDMQQGHAKLSLARFFDKLIFLCLNLTQFTEICRNVYPILKIVKQKYNTLGI